MVDPNANRVDIGIPVLIVGAGPAGLTLALALARYGVPALTVEKHPSTAYAASSHHQSAWDHPPASQQSAPLTNSGPPEPAAAAPPSPTNGFAITGLVSSLALAALGIVFGRLVHNQKKRTGEHGRGLAIGGLVVGYAMTAISVISAIVLAFIIGTAARSLNQAANPKTPPNKPQPFRPMPLGSFRN
jgi:hypothetical protein